MFIYLITNLINGQYYVGQTLRTPEVRFKEHALAAKNGKTYRICNAFRKYGAESFIVETLNTATSREQLDNLERLWILTLRSYDPSVGYNLTMGGEQMGLGYKHTLEARRKMSAAKKGRCRGPRSEEIRKKISASHIGLSNGPLSEEHRRKISEAHKGNTYNLGRKLSPEHREKIGAAHRGRKHSEEFRSKIKASWVIRKASKTGNPSA
jgi:group I intron endonuclease